MKQLIFLACIFSQLTAWGFDANKRIERQFSSADFNEFRISNEYGNLTFVPTTSDSIVVTVHIVADVIEIADTSEIFRYIENSMYKSKQTLHVNTSFDTDLDNAAHVLVHYTVHLPDTINLNIKNRYGNINLFDIYGTKKIDLEYGKIICNNLLLPAVPESSISLSFAHFEGSRIDTVNFRVNNGTVKIDTLAKSSINSSYSIFTIENARNIKCTSVNDKFEFEQIDDLNINGENTILQIHSLQEKLVADFTSGSVHIAKVSEQFNGIDIATHSSKVDIDIPSSANYYINALVQYGTFTYPKSVSLSQTKDIDKTIYTGQVGTGDDIKAQIGIIGYNSSITLK